MWFRWQSLTLWKRILIAFMLAVALGSLLKVLGLEQVAAGFEPVGRLFINAIRMLMVPIILTTIIAGVTSLKDTSRLGRLGAMTIGLYLLTTAFAVSIGLLMATLIRPGAGISLPEVGGESDLVEAPTLGELLLGLVPENPVAAMVEGNVLQIIVFAILLGLAINLAGEKGAPVKRFFHSAAEVMFKLAHMVMELAPLGVFALIVWVIGELALVELLSLVWIVVTLYAACLLHIALVYGGCIRLLGRLKPQHFFRGIVDAQAVAYSTATSAGTLPVTMANVQRNLGVSKNVSGFVLPLGATMNMDGTAIYMGIAALFTAQALGVELTMTQYLTVVLTSTLASVGAASIPAAGLIVMPIVLSSVGLPLGAIALFFPIDRLMDMMRTMTNVTGDSMVATLVAKAEGELDHEVYDAPAVE